MTRADSTEYVRAIAIAIVMTICIHICIYVYIHTYICVRRHDTSKSNSNNSTIVLLAS